MKSPTRNINYKRIDFAPCNKLIIANKLPSTNFKWLVKKSKFVGRKKPTPSTNIPVNFSYRKSEQ